MISTYARTLSNFVSTTLKLNKLYCHSGHESEVKLLIHARELMQTYLNYFVHFIPNKHAKRYDIYNTLEIKPCGFGSRTRDVCS